MIGKKEVEVIKRIMAVPEIASLPRDNFDDAIAGVSFIVCDMTGLDVRFIQSEICDYFKRGPVPESIYIKSESKLIN